MTTQELNHDTDASDNQKNDGNSVFSRILLTVLFVFVGWLSLWVLAAYVVVQFGFLIFDGDKNQRLDQFGGQLVGFQKQLLQYIAMQTDNKPFPFNEWPQNNTEKAQ